ncbi:MAG: 2OG-Fe(II) oxygenase [Acetobacteraceae bacterium]|nr:MAG: 2OG-Fe(II) oxygenase [Acetobacteraceae bacterium]
MRSDSLDLTAPLVWTVDDVLTPAECTAYIAEIDRRQPTAAPVTTGRGPVMRPDIRNNERVMIDDPAAAAELFRRIAPHVPATMRGRRASGANERLRCYRYQPGQRFAPHFDGCFRRDESEESFLTFIVYLNEGFGGGETAFLDMEKVIAPRPGRALLFQHMLLHEGCEVTSGVKYVLRTDVMYRAA